MIKFVISKTKLIKNNNLKIKMIKLNNFKNFNWSLFEIVEFRI